MPDKIQKALDRLSDREREVVKEILLRIEHNDFAGLNVQKLKGHSDIFRVRKGDIRIIFQRREGTVFILTVERRSEKTYRNF